ncbi:5373_t:CDS:2, partial [Dentiscutata erythropus]
HLLISDSVNTEIYNEGEGKEPDKVDNGNSIEQQSINLASHTLRIVKDCPTCWNLKYRAWKRLIKLKDAIATEVFSAEKYPTLSVIYPVVKVLKSEFNSNLSNIELDIDGYKPDISYYSKSDDNSESEYDNTSTQLPRIPPIQSVILKVKQEIYNSLQKYWGNRNNAGLLATLLDPRLKKMRPWPNYIKEKTIRLCCKELDTIANDRSLSIATSPATTSSTY